YSVQYPILSMVAHDYLAIQGSSLASERAFSSAGRTGTVARNQLLPETFEALQMVKNAYKCNNQELVTLAHTRTHYKEDVEGVVTP
ncbi:hypothetical protein SERLA73DRAFT_58016, partial [Serpula lacrymans var. lacrymans S7.3]